MSLKWLIVLAIACGARRAAAERSIVVDASGVPFASRELVAALRVRVSPRGAALHVHVTAIAGGVRVAAGGGVREIALEGLSGAAAARLVALAASDLVLDDLAEPPRLAAREPRVLGMLGSASMWDGAVGGVTVDLALPRGSWLAAIEVGGGQAFGGPLRLIAGIVRLDGGWRTGWLELRAGATLVPLWVSNDAGDTTVLAGAGASARARIPLGSGLRGVIAGGLDVLPTRTHYAVAGMPVLTTPLWAPWLALGVEVAL